MAQVESTALVVSAQWDASRIPSQHGRFAIVTGANSGIGFVIARELARKGAHVVLACRTESKGQEAVKRIQEEISATDHDEVVGQVEFMQLDVSSLASVKAFVQSFKTKFDRLDLLINNAGIFAVPFALTADGFESQFATNHLGHFALTAQLFDLLKNGDASSRVVNVSSNSHKSAKLSADGAVVVMTEASYSPMGAYDTSKLSNLLFTHELSRRLQEHNIHGVLSVAAHPGISRTNGVPETAKQTTSWFWHWFWRFFLTLPVFQDAAMGALPVLYAATAPNVRSGQYFGPDGFMGFWGHPTLEIPTKDSQSTVAAAKLWELSEEMAGTRFSVE